jgi:choline-glycine betaine transporter
MPETNFKLHYRGSLFWLIFWFIVFFPIAFVLLLTACTFTINDTTYNLQYDGSRFWLGFWVLVFFPIAFVLLLVNGLSVTTQRKDVIDAEVINGTPRDRSI